MGAFKRFVAGFFGITLADLVPGTAGAATWVTRQDVEQIVRSEVSAQMRQLVQQILIPELRQALQSQVGPLGQSVGDQVSLHLRGWLGAASDRHPDELATEFLGESQPHGLDPQAVAAPAMDPLPQAELHPGMEALNQQFVDPEAGLDEHAGSEHQPEDVWKVKEELSFTEDFGD